MKILIVEDELVSRKKLEKILSGYGKCDVTVNGIEGVKAFEAAWEEGEPYDLICMGIMMPEMDGKEALEKIREIEKEKGIHGSREVKVLMATSLEDSKNVVDAYYRGATSYIVKPVDGQKLLKEIRGFGFAV